MGNIVETMRAAAQGDGAAQLALAKGALEQAADPQQCPVTVLIEGVAFARMAVMNDTPDALAVLGHCLVELSRAYGERGDLPAADECYGHALAVFLEVASRTALPSVLSTVGGSLQTASETVLHHKDFYTRVLGALTAKAA